MQAPSAPIVVRIVEPNELSGLGDVLVGAIGLTGAIALGALAFGVVLAGAIIGYRNLRTRWDPDDDVPQTQTIGLS